MLTVNHLTCGYEKKTVIKDISFQVKPNEKLCILGPNGCGKTTLLRAVSGLLDYSGSVIADGLNVKTAKRKSITEKVALMSQISNIYFSYSVYETVMMGRYTHSKRGLFSSETSEDKDIVLNSLKITGTYELKDKLITELSGGQLQRVFLARTFAQDPQIILLDEPTNHLDLKYQLELIQYLSAWAKEKKRCVVGVLHDINLALSFADTLMLLNDGEIAAYETIDNFDLSLINAIYDMDIKSYMRTTLKKWA